jgi:hypothetical protein
MWTNWDGFLSEWGESNSWKTKELFQKRINGVLQMIYMSCLLLYSPK